MYDNRCETCAYWTRPVTGHSWWCAKDWHLTGPNGRCDDHEAAPWRRQPNGASTGHTQSAPEGVRPGRG